MTISTDHALVSADWLFEHHQRADVVIMDATWTLPAQQRDPKTEFWESHLPGAQYVDIDAIADHATSLPHMLPSGEVFEGFGRQFGISHDTHVVIYDSNQFMASARLWWTFRVFGHDKVSVLNGGKWAWLKAQYPLESGAIKSRPLGTFKTQRRDHLVVRREDVLRTLEAASSQLVDARPKDRFEGSAPEPRPGLRSGHIPGSRSLFFKQLLEEETPTFLSADNLETVFRTAGVNTDPQKPIIATCGSGVTAAVIALGLFQLGHQGVAIYDGSWSEWGLEKALPIATGAAL